MIIEISTTGTFLVLCAPYFKRKYTVFRNMNRIKNNLMEYNKLNYRMLYSDPVILNELQEESTISKNEITSALLNITNCFTDDYEKNKTASDELHSAILSAVKECNKILMNDRTRMYEKDILYYGKDQIEATMVKYGCFRVEKLRNAITKMVTKSIIEHQQNVRLKSTERAPIS